MSSVWEALFWGHLEIDYRQYMQLLDTAPIPEKKEKSILEQAARAQSRSFRGELAELYYYAAQACPLTEENLLRSNGGVLQRAASTPSPVSTLISAGSSLSDPLLVED
jgi:hypothetical protein